MSKLTNFILFGGTVCCGIAIYCLKKFGVPELPSSSKQTLIDSSKSVINEFTVSKKDTLDFVKDVVNWFKGIDNLSQEMDTPFIADAAQFKELLHWTSTKKYGIFMGVYNEDQDCITHARVIETEHLDDKTKEVLGNEPLVVLQ